MVYIFMDESGDLGFDYQNQDFKILCDHSTVDMACWAIYRKWEHKDGTYYRLIKPRIIEDKPLFP